MQELLAPPERTMRSGTNSARTAVTQLIRLGKSAQVSVYGKIPWNHDATLRLSTPVCYQKGNFQYFQEWALRTLVLCWNI